MERLRVGNGKDQEWKKGNGKCEKGAKIKCGECGRVREGLRVYSDIQNTDVKMLTTFPFQQDLFIDPIYFISRKGNCSYVHIVWISGPNKVATKMNSKCSDREDFKSERQRWKNPSLFFDNLKSRSFSQVSSIKPFDFSTLAWQIKNPLKRNNSQSFQS
jgi:hypothetical protein